jgi:hypothetical protein
MRMGVGVRFEPSNRVELVAKVVLRSRAGATAVGKVALSGRATMRQMSRPALGSVPIITTATMSIGTNPGFNALIGTIAATNSPTSFAITGGNTSGYFTINNGGNLRTGGSAAPPDNNYSLTVTAANSFGTSPAQTVTVTVGAIPAIASQSMNLTLPATTGEELSNVVVTAGSPTSFTITAGNNSGFFAIDNTGLITVTAAGASGITAQTYNLTVRATNALGSGTGSVAINASSVVPVAVRSFSSTSYAPRTNTVLAAPAGLAGGDVLVWAQFVGAQTTAPTVAFPAGFTALPGSPSTVTAVDGFQGKLNVAWKRAASESGNYTATHAAASSQGLLMAVQGAVSSGSPIDAVSSSTWNGSNGQTSTATSITTTAANDLLLYLGHDWEGGGTLSPPTGLAEVFDGLIYAASALQTSAGVTGNKVQANGNPLAISPWAAWLVAIKSNGVPLPPQAPIVTNGNFNSVSPATNGQIVGTMSASSSPTSWAITAGNSAGYFAISNAGTITITPAGASGLAVGTYTLTCAATNTVGSGSGTATIVVADSAWPNASNTGVPPGTTLTNYTGPMTITTAGTVIDGKIINGTLTVKADNVTIRNSILRNMSFWGILADGNPINTRVENCEIDGGSGTYHVTGLGLGGGANSAIIGCNIHGMVIAVNLWGQCLVQDNYIHDLLENDTNVDARHFDGIAYRGGGGAVGPTINHNWVDMPAQEGGTACIFIKSENGPVENTIVSNNHLTGQASMCCYSEASSGGTVSGVQFLNNVMQKGIFGYWNIVGNTPVRSGNVDYITGANIDNQG